MGLKEGKKGREREKMMRSAFATIVYSYEEEAEKRINKDKRENRGSGVGRERDGEWLVFSVIDIARQRHFLRSFLPSPVFLF